MEERALNVEKEEILQHPDYQQELLDILRSKVSPKILQEKVLDYHENDVAAVLQKLTKEERNKFYLYFEPQRLSDVFEYLEDARPYFEELSVKKRAGVLACMEADVAVSLLRSLSKTDRATLIDLIDDEAKRDIALIGSFEEDEIGSRMTTNYIKVSANMTAKQAMYSVVEQAEENDNISTIYVVDENGVFYGAIDLRDLLIARDSTELEDLILTSYPYIYGQETIDECLERLKEYSEDSIPVLGNGNKMLGVITSQSVVEVLEEAMGEDYAKLAGLTAEEDLREPMVESIKKRLPWLLVLLGLGMLVSTVVGLFESVVSELTIIICFQSLILDMAGNVGTQSLAVTIRVLMDETLTTGQKLKFAFKELRIGFMNGVILGVIAFGAIGGYIYYFKDKTLMFSFAVSGCIGMALLLAMMISSIAGTLIPMFFKKLGVDPAVASGPLITTLNDLVAVVSYYGLTWLFLLQMLHLTE